MAAHSPRPQRDARVAVLAIQLRRAARAACAAALPAALTAALLLLALRPFLAAPAAALLPRAEKLVHSASFRWPRGGDGGGRPMPWDGRAVHDAMPSPSPWWGGGGEEGVGEVKEGKGRCFLVGDAGGWRVNSRAVCYEGAPVCFSGRTLNRVEVYEARGAARCGVVAVESGQVRVAEAEELEGGCVRFREHRVVGMYGVAAFAQPGSVPPEAGAKVRWLPSEEDPGGGSLAIIVPKYDWSWNICHYNRIWQNLVYVIRNLRVFVPDAHAVSAVNIYFRTKYPYSDVWTAGIRAAMLPALQAETGLRISIARLRGTGGVTHHCVRRAVLLGAEGRVDSYPFLNDSAIWTPASQARDDHIPRIPADALWMRSVVYAAFGLPAPAAVAENGDYESVPVPPLVVAWLQRSVRSKRRLEDKSGVWFRETLASLAKVYGFSVRDVRCNGTIALSEQAAALQSAGLAVGIHGANIVNTIFMPPAAALFEIFPYKYVRYYYSSGSNSGLRYSFHEVETGLERSCTEPIKCMLQYRESKLSLTAYDRRVIVARLERAMLYLRGLRDLYPSGRIPLRRHGNMYSFAYD